jgi:hypothetical protein
MRKMFTKSGPEPVSGQICLIFSGSAAAAEVRMVATGQMRLG